MLIGSGVAFDTTYTMHQNTPRQKIHGMQDQESFHKQVLKSNNLLTRP